MPGLFYRLYSIFLRKILLANTVDPDQTPHYVASDLGLHCLPISLYGFPGKVLGTCTTILTESDEYLAMASLLVRRQSDQLTLTQG